MASGSKTPSIVLPKAGDNVNATLLAKRNKECIAILEKRRLYPQPRRIWGPHIGVSKWNRGGQVIVFLFEGPSPRLLYTQVVASCF